VFVQVFGRFWGRSRRGRARSKTSLLTDAVEKGKNEPTEIFACAPAETGFV
jgi:hypothetical protein